MKVFIIGESSQDRGKQLESLTLLILKNLNYSNCHDRVISSGGSEVDVMAELKTPLFGPTEVLCECKATAKKSDTTDWCKFLGKIFLAELSSTKPISGLFISLSGGNGNVIGSYKELIKSRSDIRILTGEELASEVSKCFPDFKENDFYFRMLSKQTDKRILTQNLIYYNNELYRIFDLEGDFYSVLNSDGNLLLSDDKVISLVNDSTNISGEFLDVSEDKKRKDLELLCEGYVLSKLIETNSSIDISQLSKEFQGELKGQSYVPEDVIASMFNELTQQPFIEGNKDVIQLDFSEIRNTLSFLNRYLSIGVFPKMLRCDTYLDLFNEDLVSKISEVQGNLPIPESDEEMLLKLLSVSPSAVIRAINPIPFIVNSRNEFENIPERLNKTHLEFFFKVLFEGLYVDYDKRILFEYYLNIDLIEFETVTNYKLKTSKNIFLEHEDRSRFAIGKMTSNGDKTITIKLIKTNDQPEPWDESHNE
ncbi:MAG: hypothetical protein COA78_05670 [Blastopirellula sp.]|nr:MAG: hypothetical protein COA78_05670 [Blastopirellula sp.]